MDDCTVNVWTFFLRKKSDYNIELLEIINMSKQNKTLQWKLSKAIIPLRIDHIIDSEWAYITQVCNTIWEDINYVEKLGLKKTVRVSGLNQQLQPHIYIIFWYSASRQ